jgi:hypothetical protein
MHDSLCPYAPSAMPSTAYLVAHSSCLLPQGSAAPVIGQTGARIAEQLEGQVQAVGDVSLIRGGLGA